MKQRDPLPALALGLVVAVLLAPVLSGRAALFYRDIHWVWYPSVESVARTLASGALPLWDPHPAFGQPALANPNYEVAYPLAWPSLLLPPRWGYTLFVALHLLLGGVGVATWLARLGASRPASVLGGAVWILSGPLAGFTSLHQHLAAVSWLPWVLATTESLLAAPAVASAVPLAVVLALQALAGSADLPWASAIAAGVRVLAGGAPGTRLATIRRLALPLLAAVALAAGLAAVQLLPSLELLRRGARWAPQGMPHQVWSLHPLSLLELWSPGFTTEAPLDDYWQHRLFGGREPFLASLYLGAACVPWALRRLLRRPLWPAVLMVVGLLMALGDNTIVYRTIGSLPPFTGLRYPVKFMAIVALAWAVATGLGFDLWLEDRGRRARTPAVAALGLAAVAMVAAIVAPGHLLSFAQPGPLWRTAAALAAAGALYWLGGRTPTRAAAMAAVALVLVDCGLAARHGLNLTASAITTFRPDWVGRLPPHTRIQARNPLGRQDELKPPPPGVSRSDWWTLAVLQQALPPIGARWGLDSAYDGDLFALQPPLAHQVTQALFSSWGRPAALRLLQLGSVDRVVSTAEEAWLGPPELTIDSAWKAPIRITRVPDPLPRARLVAGSRVLDDASGLRALLDGEVDVRREVLLPSGTPRPAGPQPVGTARIESFGADHLIVSLAAERTAFLVLAESYDPDWRATIDGRPAAVQRANLLFRAVEVPAGRHVVELVYRPPSAFAGAALTAATLLALLAALARRPRVAAGARRPRAAPRSTT